MKSVVLMLIFQKMMLPESKEMNSLIFVVNKTVLLRERKRHPAPTAQPSPSCVVGDYPILSERGVTLSCLGGEVGITILSGRGGGSISKRK